MAEDGWTDGSPALAVGPGRGARSGDGRDRPASQASRDRPRVWVAVGSRAGFPGGPAVFPVCFLRSPDGARGPVPRPPPCVLAGPSPPLPASPLLVPRVRPPAFPCPVWARAGLASRGCRPPASAGRWRPRAEQCPRSPERGAGAGGRGGWGACRRCAAGERSPRAGCGSGGGGGGGREPREGWGGASLSPRVVPWDRPCAGRGLWR